MSAFRTCLVLLLLAMPAAAAAQGAAEPLSTAPLPWVVVDVRAAWPGLGEDETTLADLGVSAQNLPGRALAGIGGVHVYPLRRGFWKVGIGAEFLRGRGSYQPKDTSGDPVGDELVRTLESLSWQLSMNFGRGRGWSYVTVGSGQFTLDSYVGAGPGDAPSTTTLNLGGGARWFKWPHLGLNVDLRFYMSKAAAPGALSAARGAQRVVVLSVGATLK
jgi:hypothetical protein